jgi:Ser/Thr protein kinase RdoA (MazF antagonist)
MTPRYDWTAHFTRPPAPTQDAFVHMDADGCAQILEQRGLPRAPVTQLESSENRVFLAGDVVVKAFRPGRWSREALLEEVVFLEDLRDAGVSAVRPIGTIGTWQGVHHLAYERIAPPYEEDRAVFGRADVERLVKLVADVHRVGASRDAPHRPRLEPVGMGRDLLEVIDARGYLPATVAGRYRAAVEAMCARLEGLLEGVPQQRIHADIGSWNVAWRGGEPVLMDLDDFQVGPVALDVRLMSFPWRLDTLPEGMDRKERRERQHELVASLYAEHHAFEPEWEALFKPTSMLRGVVFDAWFAHNWDEPGFKEHYPDDDITGEAYWLAGIEGLERWLGE